MVTYQYKNKGFLILMFKQLHNILYKNDLTSQSPTGWLLGCSQSCSKAAVNILVCNAFQWLFIFENHKSRCMSYTGGDNMISPEDP